MYFFFFTLSQQEKKNNTPSLTDNKFLKMAEKGMSVFLLSDKLTHGLKHQHFQY